MEDLRPSVALGQGYGGQVNERNGPQEMPPSLMTTILEHVVAVSNAGSVLRLALVGGCIGKLMCQACGAVREELVAQTRRGRKCANIEACGCACSHAEHQHAKTIGTLHGHTMHCRPAPS